MRIFKYNLKFVSLFLLSKIFDVAASKKEQILLWHKITFCAVCITVVGSIIAIVLVLQNKSEQQRSTDRPTDSQSPVTSSKY